MENLSLTAWTRTQFPPTKSLLSTYLTCHSSAIYTCKVTCLPCMLFTCLFLLSHVNYALNYTCSNCWQGGLFRNGAAQAVFHSTRSNAIPTSGFAQLVFWRISALETIVNNLKSTTNFGNLNVFSYINEIYLVADFWWNVSFDEWGWANLRYMPSF